MEWILSLSNPYAIGMVIEAPVNQKNENIKETFLILSYVFQASKQSIDERNNKHKHGILNYYPVLYNHKTKVRLDSTKYILIYYNDANN